MASQAHEPVFWNIHVFVKAWPAPITVLSGIVTSDIYIELSQALELPEFKAELKIGVDDKYVRFGKLVGEVRSPNASVGNGVVFWSAADCVADAMYWASRVCAAVV